MFTYFLNLILRNSDSRLTCAFTGVPQFPPHLFTRLERVRANRNQDAAPKRSPLSVTKFPLAERQWNAANPRQVGPKRSFRTGPPTDVREVLSSVSFMQRPH